MKRFMAKADWTGRKHRCRRFLLQWCLSLAFLHPATAVLAQEGVTSDAVVISRVIALEGPAGAKGREQEAALQAYFNAVNSAGGVHGRKIALRTTNFDLHSDETLKAIRESQHPFAFFLFGGTSGSAVAMKLATASKIPFVAPNSGANVFHQPVNGYVFNVRARYQDEVIAAMRHFVLLNQRRLALVHVDDVFGRDAAQGYRDGISDAGAVSVYESALASDPAGLSQQVDALAKANPQAVICIGASKRVAEFIALTRQARITALFMTLSNNSSAGFARELGAYSRGVLVSQVMPPAASRTTRLSRELTQLLSQREDSEISYAAMEAYISAKVLVEGLKRAGPRLTREGFVQALESMRRFDLGGFEVDYSPTKHTGSRYVELSILTAEGKYRQ